MHEKLVIVPAGKTTLKKVLNILWFVLACFCFLCSMIAPVIFLIPAIGLTVIWVWQAFRSHIEYEYTYYDGDLRIAKIKNKARRKRIAVVNMEDVILIAPKGDRSVYKYENDNSLKCKKLISGNSDAKIYELICKGENEICRYEFEPDEAMLDEMRIKYARLVTK